ncbi:MAG TPA: DUF5008 domain-containing protein [Niabella sp.]|nr:DUF5008 domain-containing protein [Niabella sp.]HQX20870.1 DUF5008 domain-containing protein [Niabella sp.]HQX41562.1 DUF5008 domain-containing protein [Niabella sp.]HRB08350.1 DUF5008 domain-containing protein [Niabella sp.]HRB48561.1 DUF5008 domain-containing protein [Niabella sp.]
MIFQLKQYNRLPLLWACGLLLLTASCTKSDFGTTDIYQEGTEADISFTADAPQPAMVSEGTIVKYGIAGLKDKAQGTYKFYINQVQANILEVTDKFISVRVPANASSGSASLVFDNGQLYYGPSITVRGNTQIASDFLANIGANKALSNNNASFASIYGITPRSDGNYVIYGEFNNYGNTGTANNITSGIQVIDATGKTLSAGNQFIMGKRGLNGVVADVKILSDGSYLVTGGFSKYDTIENVNSIVRFKSDRTFDFLNYEVANADPENHPEDNTRIGSAINGGVDGGALFSFMDVNGSYMTVGNYRRFSSIYYPNSTVESSQLDAIQTFGLSKMNNAGVFDSAFNYDISTKKSFAGANGFITTAIQLYYGQLVLGGAFTSFHGQSAQRLVCIDPATGLISSAFSGTTDGPVYKITYNENTERLVVIGNFKHYNGVPVNGVAVLNEDGSLDTASPIKATDGVVTYCAQLNDGRFIISGSFIKYDNVVRTGFAILNQDGTLATGYNNTGLFRGRIGDHAEYSTPGGRALMLVGNFDRFDNKEVGNIVKIVLSNN